MRRETRSGGNVDLTKIKVIFEDFLSSSPEKKAKIIAEDLLKVSQWIKTEKTTKHQVRKYYHYFLDILESSVDEDSFKKKLPKIAIANSYIQYDKARKTIGRVFATFVEEFVKRALNTNREGFKELLMLFEAFVGYTSYKNNG